MAAAPYDITWLACDLGTGAIQEELPSLMPQEALSRSLGTYTTTSFNLALDGAPPAWVAATAPGRTMAVAVWDGRPQWAGIFLTRQRGSDNAVPLNAVTAEAYLDRRFTGSQIFAGSDQALIAYGLMSAALTNGPVLALDAPAMGGSPLSITYADDDDTSIYSALQTLMAGVGGPEWTIDPEWADASQSTVQLVARVRPKIGVQLPDPEGVFDFPGCIGSYSQAESYESGKGANYVLAYGNGEGDGRVSGTPAVATDLLAQGWPRYDYRYTPSVSIVTPGILTSQAASSLATMQTGASVWSVTANAGTAPRIGTDWALGDNVRIVVAPGTSPGHPDGVDIVARAWQWQLDTAAQTVSPILVEDGTDS